MNTIEVKRWSKIAMSVLAVAAAAGCGGEVTEEAQSHTYQTTSNVGDLSTWTIDGDALSVEWKDISPSGEVEKTYQASATCDPVDPTFGNRACHVEGDAACVAGTVACQPGDGPQDGDLLNVFEVPGVALLVAGDGEDQLHTGFAAGSCEDVGTDDYTFVNVGLGQRDVFGLFRTNANLTNAVHMDFGFSDDPENQISYRTNDPAGIVPSITASPCANGVRELTIDASGDKIRLVVTASGHLVLDKPEGAGGLIAINAASAATIDDFADKSWGGIAFPDDSPPQLIDMTTGALSGGKVSITKLVLSGDGDITPAGTGFISDGASSAKLNEALLEPADPYNTNNIVFGGDYTGGPSELPGIFEVGRIVDETAIVAIGATADGRTMLFGAVVNQLEDASNGLKGNFVLFEK